MLRSTPPEELHLSLEDRFQTWLDSVGRPLVQTVMTITAAAHGVRLSIWPYDACDSSHGAARRYATWLGRLLPGGAGRLATDTD